MALIERLEALLADALVADIKCVLAEVDAAWRGAGDVPGKQVGALDARWRAASLGDQHRVADHAHRSWHATCDALRDKLALCVAQEAQWAQWAQWAQGGSAPDGPEDFEGRWSALPTLPSPWENALAKRRASAASDGGAGGPADDALLNLEIALDLPSPAEHESARRDLRLRALKGSMEGRPSAAEPMGDVASLIAQVLGMVGLNEPRQRRLSVVIGALRAGGAAQG